MFRISYRTTIRTGGWRQAVVPMLLALPLALAGCDRGPPTTADGTPLLVQAAERGDLATVQRLTAGPDPALNLRDPCQRTPLMLAAQQGHDRVVAYLLDAGALVNLHEKGHYTALHLAAANGHLEVVRLLAAANANLDDVERTQGWTPLIWAAKRGKTDTVALLLALGADPAIRDHRGRSAADWATQEGHLGVREMLSRAAAR